MALSEEVIDEYKTSLKDLNVNSKPLINMLTMLAEDHEQHAPEIVEVIEDHIYKCKPVKKLPVLYLMDSIMKNLGQTNYKSLFAKNIVQTFTSVFEQVDEKTRASMFKLRQTWASILPNQKLYMIDVRINNLMDPAWPITAMPPEQTSIHVNPKFLPKSGSSGSGSERSSPEAMIEEEEEEEKMEEDDEALMRRQLIAKQQELLELQQARLNLELLEAQEKLKKSHKKQVNKPSQKVSSTKASSLPMPPEIDDFIIDDELQAELDLGIRPVDPSGRDPRLQTMLVENTVGSTQLDEDVPLETIPFSGSTVVPFSGNTFSYGNMPGYSGSTFHPTNSLSPFMHKVDSFKGMVFPEEAKFSDSNDSDSSRSSAQENRGANIPVKPKVNVKDPRLRKQLEQAKETQQRLGKQPEQVKEVQHTGIDSTKIRSNQVSSRDPRRHSPSSKSFKSEFSNQHKNTEHNRESGTITRDLNCRRSSKERESVSSTSKSPRRSSSDNHQSSKRRSNSRDRDSKSHSNLRERETFEIEKRKHEESKKRTDSNSKTSKKDLVAKHSEVRSKSKEKSPEKQSKHQSSKSSHHKGSGDSSESDHKKKNEGRIRDNRKSDEKYKHLPGSKSQNKSNSNSDTKVEIKTEPMEEDKIPEPVSVKSGKREKQTEELEEDERAFKKQKLSEEKENSSVVMDVDMQSKVEPKVSSDLSDLFGSEDIDYRPVDQKGLPLQSPSSKGWDKFKASQPDKFAYDIELKKQRQDMDQRRTRQMSEASENLDFDLRVQPQDSLPSETPLSPPVIGQSIPKELSLSQHSEIIIQAQKQLREGRINAKQHQELMNQVQKLMHIQQQLQEENSKSERQALDLLNVKEETLSPQSSSLENQRRESRSPDRPLEHFRIPKKVHDIDSPRKPKGGLHELYPERIKEEAWESGPPVLSREFDHPRFLADNKSDGADLMVPPDLEEGNQSHGRTRQEQFKERRGPDYRGAGYDRHEIREPVLDNMERFARRKVEELGLENWKKHGSDEPWGEQVGSLPFVRKDRMGPVPENMPDSLREGPWDRREQQGAPWDVPNPDNADFRENQRHPVEMHLENRAHPGDENWRSPTDEEAWREERGKGRSRVDDRYAMREERSFRNKPDIQPLLEAPIGRGRGRGDELKRYPFVRPGRHELDGQAMQDSNFDQQGFPPTSDRLGHSGPQFIIEEHERPPEHLKSNSRRTLLETPSIRPLNPPFDKDGPAGSEGNDTPTNIVKPMTLLPNPENRPGQLGADFDRSGPPRSDLDRLGPSRPDFDEPGPTRPDYGRPRPSASDFDRPGPPGPEFGRPGPQRNDFDRPGLDRSEFDVPPRPQFDRPGPPEPKFDRPGPPRAGFERPVPPRPEFDGSGPPRPDFERQELPRPEFDRAGPQRPELDRPGPPRPDFDRPRLPGPEFDRVGPPRPEFDGLGPPRPEFDRPEFDRPEFDRSGPARPEFDRPGPTRQEFDRPGPPRPEFDRPGPPRPEFDRSGPPRPEFDRPGPPRPEYDRSGPIGSDSNTHGPRRPEFDRSGPMGPDFDRPGPGRPEFERHGNARLEFDRTGREFDHTDPEFGRNMLHRPEFDRHGPPRLEFDRSRIREDYDNTESHQDRYNPNVSDFDRPGPALHPERNYDGPEPYGPRHGRPGADGKPEFDRHGHPLDGPRIFRPESDRAEPKKDRYGRLLKHDRSDRELHRPDFYDENERLASPDQDLNRPRDRQDPLHEQKDGRRESYKADRSRRNQDDGHRRSEKPRRRTPPKEDTEKQDNHRRRRRGNRGTSSRDTDHKQDSRASESRSDSKISTSKALTEDQKDDLKNKVDKNGKMDKNSAKQGDDKDSKVDDKTKPKFDPNRGLPPWKPVQQRSSPAKEKPRNEKKREEEKPARRNSPPLSSQRLNQEKEEKRKHSDKIPSLLDGIDTKPLEGPKRSMGIGLRNKDPSVLVGPQFNPSPSQIGLFPDGPHGRPKDMMLQPDQPKQPVESYVDKYGDPRFRSFADMGPVVSEEIVLGKKNYEIKLGAPPRKIQWANGVIEVYADPSKRGIVIDNELMYRFGERVKEVTIRGKRVKLFYHGKPLDIWIDGNNYEVRVDSPPKTLIINNQPHRIQVDGRDMMILIDKAEKGPFGGEPRYILIDDIRMELRFDPPPRHILIDGEMCELKLNTKQPCINVKGVFRGIRFKGPPRDVFINGSRYQIHTDHAVKIRVGNKYHYVALGGPCHEVIVDGKWYEVKFDEPPKEITVGNRVLMIAIPGAPPEVQILDPVSEGPQPPNIPMFNMGPQRMPMPGPPGPMGPGPHPMMPNIPAMLMGTQLLGPNPLGNLPGFRPPMSGQTPTSIMPGIGNVMQEMPSTQPNRMPLPGISQAQGMPGILSGLFPPRPAAPQPAPAPVDINSLLSKLVSSGIIKKEKEVQPPTSKAGTEVKSKSDPAKPVEPINVMTKRKEPAVKPETIEEIPDKTSFDLGDLKEFHIGAVQRLYAGVQCNSCGTRFLLDNEVKAEKYREHLDWHFRQNKLKKDDTKVSKCRKWYYGVSDWIQYEEVTDLEDQSKSIFFEQQNTAQPSTPSQNSQIALITVPEGASVFKCPAATGNDQDDLCNICHEPFEQYWDEELEEWHLRDAIRVNEKTYHPICYEDYTDVSEGTPSPAILQDKQPDFSSRKSLTYEESSQDDLPHSSFEEERIVPSQALPVKTEPTQEKSELFHSASVKSEPDVESSNMVNENKQTSDGSIPASMEISSTSDITVKQEPVPMDSSVDYKSSSQTANEFLTDIVKQEPPNSINDQGGEGSTFFSNSYSKGAIPGLDVTFETHEEAMDTSDTGPEHPSSSTSIIDNKDSSSSEPASTISAGSDMAVDVKTESDGHKCEIKEEIIEPKQEGVSTENCEAGSPLLDERYSKMDFTEEKQATQRSLIEATERHHIPVLGGNDSQTIAQPVSLDNENERQHLTAPIPHSSLSPLKCIKASQPSDLFEISQEVLEIGSNASTPTHDELPSPPSPGS